MDGGWKANRSPSSDSESYRGSSCIRLARSRKALHEAERKEGKGSEGRTLSVRSCEGERAAKC